MRRRTGRFGRKPSKVKWSVGRPETTRAATRADGPGITSTGIPSAMASRTRSYPGSEMAGVPASETSATLSPSRRRRRIPAPARALLYSWKTTIGVRIS